LNVSCFIIENINTIIYKLYVHENKNNVRNH